MATKAQLMQVIQVQSEIARLGLDLSEVMNLVVERVQPLMQADGAVIELVENEDMVYAATSGIAEPFLGLRLKQGESLSGLCVRAGKLLRCNDTETDARVAIDACRQIGLRSMMVMPLVHQGEVVGVLKAMSSQPDRFGKKDEQLLGQLSDVVSSAMYFATRYDRDSLFFKATHDSMTGLANRSLFMDRLRNAVARHERDQSSVAVLALDMNDFKAINDTHGHRVGDAVLKELARRLALASRQSDTIARWGGDEFVIMLAPVDVPDGVDATIERLQADIGQPFEFEGHTLHLNVSMGAASFPDDTHNLDLLLELADLRMYAVKKAYHSG
ncbi:sensor domain-containing diguanylate cyclase [Leeia oryzae]|uniref:sensor domain-containing diguanylate cyclase n=1 Tax=Leeia oryzae TaxID=356662 RepID=UPI0003A50D01|nr:sensor domain-containing diguanylate cyclase [Leeia oryzae]